VGKTPLNAYGICTRGDNNPHVDPYRLQPADVIGQVVAAQRGVKRRRIAGGRWGALRGMACRPRRVINRGVSQSLHGAYRGLAGRFRGLLPAHLRPRVFAFQARNQTLLKLLLGRRVIGQYDTRKEQWRIRRPFRLLVDEAGLPVPEPRRYARAAHAVREACGRRDAGRIEDSAAGPGDQPVI